jgi:HSP20 family protein
MNLARWDPFTDIDRFFNRMLPSLSRWSRLHPQDEGNAVFEWSPSADVSETDQEYLIRAELPGIKKEDVKVTLDQGMLTIHGERKQERVEQNERFHRVENTYGSFTRTFSLPDNVRPDAIRCDSKDGLLTVHIPKKERKQQAKEISVQ